MLVDALRQRKCSHTDAERFPHDNLISVSDECLMKYVGEALRKTQRQDSSFMNILADETLLFIYITC